MNLFKEKRLKLNVNRIEEYLSLPKEEREFFGLYKIPHSLPWSPLKAVGRGLDEWDKFYKIIKKEYPMQWFFRYWLFSYDNPVYLFFKSIHWSLRDFRWAFKNFINPNYKRWRASLKRHEYKDISTLIEDSNFALILDFYHGEACKGWINWEYDEPHKNFYNKLLEYVNWIEKERPKLEIEISEELSNSTENPVLDGEKGFDYFETYKKLHELEKQLEEKTSEIIKWLVDNRAFFWT
jgi:hypothetical protein